MDSRTPIINIAISAACETEGKNAMLMMGCFFDG